MAGNKREKTTGGRENRNVLYFVVLVLCLIVLVCFVLGYLVGTTII